MQDRRSELYLDVERNVAYALQEEGIPLVQAQRVAAGVADVLTTSWGGQTIYFPKDSSRVLAHRAAQILAEYTGNNLGALAAKYSYTEHGIRRLIKRARQLTREIPT